MVELLVDKRVHTVVSDQCEYGLTSLTPDGHRLPSKKPTEWATASPQIAARLCTRCSGTHRHQRLIGGGGRAADAAFYPTELVTEILRGLRDTEDAENLDQPPELTPDVVAAMSVAGSLHDFAPDPATLAIREADAKNTSKAGTTKFRMSDGSIRTLNLDNNVKDGCRDEYTRDFLPHNERKDAMLDGFAYFNDTVWCGVHTHEARADPGAKIVGTRWVLSNQGDSAEPDVRARLVAQEVATYQNDNFYAATPHLEAKQLLFSQWATEQFRDNAFLKLSFIDVRKA